MILFFDGVPDAGNTSSIDKKIPTYTRQCVDAEAESQSQLFAQCNSGFIKNKQQACIRSMYQSQEVMGVNVYGCVHVWVRVVLLSFSRMLGEWYRFSAFHLPSFTSFNIMSRLLLWEQLTGLRTKVHWHNTLHYSKWPLTCKKHSVKKNTLQCDLVFKNKWPSEMIYNFTDE